MIGILLLILKIIGITLLVILGIVILLLVIILFMPIVYSVKGTMHTEIQTLEIKGNVRWLFGLVRIEGCYNYPKFEWSGLLAWYQLNEEKKVDSKEVKPSKSELKNTRFYKTKLENTNQNTEQDIEQNTEQNIKQNTEKLDETKKISWKEKWSAKQKRILDVKQKIIHIFRFICDTIQMIIQKKEKALELYYVEEHQHTITKCKALLLVLWKKIRPKKFCITAKIGFEDPSLTGKMLGVLGVLIPFYGDTIHVEPQFENVVYDGNINIKGHFCLYPLVVVLIKLVTDKKVRVTYNNIKAFEL